MRKRENLAHVFGQEFRAYRSTANLSRLLLIEGAQQSLGPRLGGAVARVIGEMSGIVNYPADHLQGLSCDRMITRNEKEMKEMRERSGSQ